MLALFGFMWIALLLQKAVVCGRDEDWHGSRNVQCLLGETVGIVTLISKSRHGLAMKNRLLIAAF